MLKKAELTDRLSTIRKAFEKQRKDKETAANKAVSRVLLDCSRPNLT